MRLVYLFKQVLCRNYDSFIYLNKSCVVVHKYIIFVSAETNILAKG